MAGVCGTPQPRDRPGRHPGDGSPTSRTFPGVAEYRRPLPPVAIQAISRATAAEKKSEDEPESIALTVPEARRLPELDQVLS